MKNTIFEIEKHEKQEETLIPPISLYTFQTIEKENDSFDVNDFLDKDNISIDKLLEIRTKANTNEGKFYVRKKIDEKQLFKYLDVHKNISFKNNNVNNSGEIPNENNKKKCGRKRIRPEDNKGEHNKFSDDNIRRKCKHLVLKSVLKFINKKIINLYNGKIGEGILKKQLHIINQSQKSNATINFNKDFLNKSLKDIFSENITSRYSSFPLDNNKVIIKRLLNEKDANKRQYFTNLFNLNFIQCLRHFRGEYTIEELEGLNCFKDIKLDLLKKYIYDGKDYVNVLEYYLKNYEKITNNKKGRQTRKEKV